MRYAVSAMTAAMILSLSASALAATPGAVPTAAAAKASDAAGGKSRMFEENDSNNDGFISKKEWQVKSEKLFSEIDMNNDGQLAPEESKAHSAMMREKRKARRAKERAAKPAVTEKPAAVSVPAR